MCKRVSRVPHVITLAPSKATSPARGPRLSSRPWKDARGAQVCVCALQGLLGRKASPHSPRRSGNVRYNLRFPYFKLQIVKAFGISDKFVQSWPSFIIALPLRKWNFLHHCRKCQLSQAQAPARGGVHLCSCSFLVRLLGSLSRMVSASITGDPRSSRIWPCPVCCLTL